MISVAGVAQAAPYIFIKIDAPFSGTTDTLVAGINDNGEIAGTYFTPGSALPCDAGITARGFLLSGGDFSSFDLPPTCITFFHGINSEGQIVGEKQGPGEGFFSFSGGEFSIIDAPCGVRGINNAAHMVGSTSVAGTVVGCLLADGSVSHISVPGALSTSASAINDTSQIVGGFTTCPATCLPFFARSHGYLLTDGVFSTVDFPGARNTSATGINNSGAIIGTYSASPESDPFHGFILDNEVYSTIDFPGSTSTSLAGINNAGEIVGVYGLGRLPASHGFLARPAAVVNELVHLSSVNTSFDETPVPGGPVGTFTIEASFANTSSTPIDAPQFVVTQLSNGNLLLNADLPPGTVGARLTPDGGSDAVLSPGESFNVEFVIGLEERRAFTFLVDLLGVPGL